MKKMISDFTTNAHPLVTFIAVYAVIFVLCYIGGKIYHRMFPDEIE